MVERQGEEVTAVYILRAEGKLLNYRWVKLIREEELGKNRRGGTEEKEQRQEERWIKSDRLQDRSLLAKHAWHACTYTRKRSQLYWIDLKSVQPTKQTKVLSRPAGNCHGDDEVAGPQDHLQGGARQRNTTCGSVFECAPPCVRVLLCHQSLK